MTELTLAKLIEAKELAAAMPEGPHLLCAHCGEKFILIPEPEE